MFMADTHELAVIQKLEDARFEVVRFGQGLLSPELRELLKQTRSKIRWLPDILAVRLPLVLWVDAKTGRRDTPNYGIETEALLGHRALVHAGYDVVIVWPDFCWSRAAELHPDDLQPGVHIGNGSGTPFLLVRKWLAHPWSELVR
jgi:hypothetical protein